MRRMGELRFGKLMKLEKFGLLLPGRGGGCLPGEGATVPLSVSVLPNPREPRSVACNSETC